MSEIRFNDSLILKDWEPNQGGNWFRRTNKDYNWIALIKFEEHKFTGWAVYFVGPELEALRESYYNLYGTKNIDLDKIKNQVDTFLNKILKFKAFM